MFWNQIPRRAFLKGWGVGALAFTLPGISLSEVKAQSAMGNSDTFVAEDMGKWIAALRYEDLPTAVVEKARRLLLDTVGCALGGLNGEPVRLARETVFLQGGNPQSTLIGLGRKVSADQAAFVNGMAIRYLDFNDYTPPGGHPSINIAPALAVAEMQNRTGKDLLLSIAIGHEVYVRMREATIGDDWSDGFDMGTIPLNYTSAALAAKLLGLDGIGIANAMAIAGAHGNTLAEVRRGGMLSGGSMTPSKGTAGPMSVRNGTFAAMMAAQGMTYPLSIFEGAYGFQKYVTQRLDEDILRNRSGDFKILLSMTKMWPCHKYCQGPIAAAIEVYDQGVKPDEIESITVFLSAMGIENQQVYNRSEITVREHADHNMPYYVTRALLDGNVTDHDFDPESFRERRALDTMKRVRLRLNPNLDDSPENWDHVKMEVKLRNGKVHKAEVINPPGTLENPPTETMLVKKFMGMAEEHLGKAGAEKAVETILDVDQITDVGRLMNVLTA
ncbi:MAG: 2-methylcitrate dehydratase [Planctomycetota bacterium]|jgi:2-methylcitrate dehydratase